MVEQQVIAMCHSSLKYQDKLCLVALRSPANSWVLGTEAGTPCCAAETLHVETSVVFPFLHLLIPYKLD